MLKTTLVFLLIAASSFAFADTHVIVVRLGDGSKDTKDWAEVLMHPERHPSDVDALASKLDQYGKFAIFLEMEDYSTANLTYLYSCKECKDPKEVKLSPTASYAPLRPELNDGSCKVEGMKMMSLRDRMLKCYYNDKAYTKSEWLTPNQVPSLVQALKTINGYLYHDIGRRLDVMEKAVATYKLKYYGKETYYDVWPFDFLEITLAANGYGMDFGNPNYWAPGANKNAEATKVYAAGSALEAAGLVYVHYSARCSALDEKHPALEFGIIPRTDFKVYLDAGKCSEGFHIGLENPYKFIPAAMEKYGFRYRNGKWIQKK